MGSGSWVDNPSHGDRLFLRDGGLCGAVGTGSGSTVSVPRGPDTFPDLGPWDVSLGYVVPVDHPGRDALPGEVVPVGSADISPFFFFDLVPLVHLSPSDSSLIPPFPITRIRTRTPHPDLRLT